MTKDRPSAKARRTSARLSATQLLYRSMIENIPPSTFAQNKLNAFPTTPLDETEGEALVPPDQELLWDIVLGIERNRDALDTHLTATVTERDFNAIEPLLRSILLCGAHELVAYPMIDTGIIINDYVNIAHAYYAQTEPGFVNAVLDRLAKTVRV